MIDNSLNNKDRSKAYGMLWALEFWERFGYYGVQAVLALYFVKSLGFTDTQAFYVFGSFAGLNYGFIWLGGFIGDKYLGAKRTIVIGALILFLGYCLLLLSSQTAVLYSLSCIVVGSALFKSNPTSLISKMYQDSDSKLDGAITMYYMAVNVGGGISMALIPILVQFYGWHSGFGVCAIGLVIALSTYTYFYGLLKNIATEAGSKKLKAA